MGGPRLSACTLSLSAARQHASRLLLARAAIAGLLICTTILVTGNAFPCRMVRPHVDVVPTVSKQLRGIARCRILLSLRAVKASGRRCSWIYVKHVLIFATCVCGCVRYGRVCGRGWDRRSNARSDMLHSMLLAPWRSDPRAAPHVE